SKPWIYDAHEDYSGMISDLAWPLPTVATLLERYVVSKSDGIITVSPSIMKRLVSYGAKRRLMIFNSRTTEHFSSNVSPHEFRKELGIDSSKLVLLYIGSLGPGRSVMEAIDAVNSGDKNHLILGGHGMWATKVSEAIRDSKNVTFLGTVPSDNLPKYFSIADVILGMRDPGIPDHAISLPNKFFEAAAAKKPIVASSGTFVGELVLKHKLGKLADYGSVESLLKSLDSLRDVELRMRCGESGAELLSGKFGWKWQARKLNLLYNNLVKK
ncbi:MAG: glycosyltransferase, partial [Candidatus Thermoplasmatota archaeon]|nr:glycosyltransferase [Candidatus Thermoplasmatota archaeon]